MDMYQHDTAAMFKIVLRGELSGSQVLDLEHAWTTAKSILNGRELIVDVSGMTHADRPGVDLLSRMRESGARLTAALPPASGEFLRTSGIPVAAPGGWRPGTWALRLLRFFRPGCVPPVVPARSSSLLVLFEQQRDGSDGEL
jgi:hypothetical protein